jgi:hypothetical protein
LKTNPPPIVNPLYAGFVLTLASAAWGVAQETVTPSEAPPSPVVAPAEVAAPSSIAMLTDAQLDQLMGPIALYPDALLALILPAATDPTEVVLAARYLAAKNPADQIDKQPWSESVKGLARYPDVVAWMDTNLSWTQQVGEAFVAQPAAMMNSVQRLRSQARAVGTLTDSPEQRVVVEERIIRIEPAQVNVIYVPRYDPAIVYVSRPLGLRSSFISFSYGYSTGIWLAYACDWHHRTVVVLDHHHRAPYYNRPFYPVYSHHHHSRVTYHQWTPPVKATRPRPDFARVSHTTVNHPATIVGTPSRRSDSRSSQVGQPQSRHERSPAARLQADDDNNRKRSGDSRRVSVPEKTPRAPSSSAPRMGAPDGSVFRPSVSPRQSSDPVTRPAQQRENRWPPRPAPEPARIQPSIEEKKPERSAVSPAERFSERRNDDRSKDHSRRSR